MKKRPLSIALFLFLFVPVLSIAKAETIFDNYGASPGYKTSGAVGYGVGPVSFGPPNLVAAPFTPSTDTYFNSFDVPIWNDDGDATSIMQFSLVGDNGGLPGATLIETYSLTLGATNSMNSYSVYSTLNPLLTAGQKYWLVASSTDGAAWLYTTSNDTSAYAVTVFGNWYSMTPEGVGDHIALRAFGSSQSTVPIPGAVWLLGSGLLGLVGVRRKIRS